MVTRREQGAILIWVTFMLMGMASLLLALNLYLSGFAEQEEYTEQEMAWILCRDGLNWALVTMEMAGSGGFPVPDATNYTLPWGWNGSGTNWGVNLAYQAESNTTHFPDTSGRIRCKAKTQRGSTLTVYATLYRDWEYSTYLSASQWRYRYYPHSFRSTQR